MPDKQRCLEKQPFDANGKKTRQIFCWQPRAETFFASNYSPQNFVLKDLYHRIGQAAVSQFLPGPFPRRLIGEAIKKVFGAKISRAKIVELERAFLALPFIRVAGDLFTIDDYNKLNGSVAHHAKRAEEHKHRKAKNLIAYRARLKS